jgi:hypothetical protein
MNGIMSFQETSNYQYSTGELATTTAVIHHQRINAWSLIAFHWFRSNPIWNLYDEKNEAIIDIQKN